MGVGVDTYADRQRERDPFHRCAHSPLASAWIACVGGQLLIDERLFREAHANESAGGGRDKVAYPSNDIILLKAPRDAGVSTRELLVDAFSYIAGDVRFVVD